MDAVAGLREELAEVRRQRDALAADNELLRRTLAGRDDPVAETFEHGADSREAVGRTGGRLFALGAGDATAFAGPPAGDTPSMKRTFTCDHI